MLQLFEKYMENKKYTQIPLNIISLYAITIVQKHRKFADKC